MIGLGDHLMGSDSVPMGTPGIVPDQQQLEEDLETIKTETDEALAEMDAEVNERKRLANEKIKKLELQMWELSKGSTFPLLPVIGLAVVGIGAIFFFSRKR